MRRSRAFLDLVGPLCILVAAVVSGSPACTPRTLIEVDVTGDAPFDSVRLRLSASGTSKDFAGATFSPTVAYKAGLYVDASGNVDVVANVLDSSGQCIGAGAVSLTGVSAGAASGPTTLMVTHTTACNSVTAGTGGSSGATGGNNGSGGETTTGPGGSSGSTGSGGNGNSTGGASGSGGMTGGGGMTGSGGQSGGTNIVVNGDFSNGSSSWGIPYMMGQVNQSVTGGQFCVTLGAASVATIGYPSGATPPFQISGGVSYTLSYQASSTGNLTVEAKVGDVNPPNDATGSDWMNEPVNGSLQPFMHTFTRGSTNSMMGIAFNVMGGPGTFCVDNVSLIQN